MPRKIFAVTSGSYSDYGVDALFSTKKKANDYVARFPSPDCNGVSEWEVDPAIPPKNHLRFMVQMELTGDVISIESDNEFISRYSDRDSVMLWERTKAAAYRNQPDITDLLRMTIFARDKDQAVKIAAEKFAEWMYANPKYIKEGS